MADHNFRPARLAGIGLPLGKYSKIACTTWSARSSTFASQMSEIDPQSLTSAKASKRNLLEGVVRFNEKPKNGISFLEAKGLIYTDGNAHLPKHEALAVFLKNCPRLDKKLLGDYLSRPDNLDTLKAFLGLCNFENVGSSFSR